MEEKVMQDVVNIYLPLWENRAHNNFYFFELIVKL